MINPITSGVAGAVKGIGEAVSGVGRVFWGDKAEEARDSHGAYMASIAQFAQEFDNAKNRTWFDVLIDGLNRLPRPMLAFGAIFLVFVYPMIDPVGFSIRMQGMALVPEPLWWIMFAIVSYFFGARELSKGRNTSSFTPPTREQVGVLVDNVRAIESLEHAAPGIASIDEETFQAQMNDTKPMSNSAILEWNKRNG